MKSFEEAFYPIADDLGKPTHVSKLHEVMETPFGAQFEQLSTMLKEDKKYNEFLEHNSRAFVVHFLKTGNLPSPDAQMTILFTVGLIVGLRMNEGSGAFSTVEGLKNESSI